MKYNIFGLHEYTRQDIFVDATDEVRDADRFYIMIEADEVIADLKTTISKATEAQRWRKVSKELPPKHEWVFASDGKNRMLGKRVDGAWLFDGAWMTEEHGVIKYWMPLPKPPKEGK